MRGRGWKKVIKVCVKSSDADESGGQILGQERMSRVVWRHRGAKGHKYSVSVLEKLIKKGKAKENLI